VKPLRDSNTTQRYTRGYRLISDTVARMSSARLAYYDQDSAHQRRDDCTACGSRITLPRLRIDHNSITMPAPSLEFDTFPRQPHKRDLEVTDAAAQLASRMHLALD